MRSVFRIVALLVFIASALPSLSAAQVSIGIRIGPPPAARSVRAIPHRPGPGYVWVEGYWYPVRGSYQWHDGYWTRPPYAGAHWVRPHYSRNQFFAGYWDGSRGRFEHDHQWDGDHDRDQDRDHNAGPNRSHRNG